MTNQMKLAALKVLQAVHEAVASCPDGIPAGTIYANLMTQGCTLEQYESLERILIGAGAIKKKGDLLFPS